MFSSCGSRLYLPSHLADILPITFLLPISRLQRVSPSCFYPPKKMQQIQFAPTFGTFLRIFLSPLLFQNNCHQLSPRLWRLESGGIWRGSLLMTITLAITTINGSANYQAGRVNILRWGGGGCQGDGEVIPLIAPGTGSGQPAQSSTDIQKCRHILEYRNTKLQIYQTSELHKYRYTEISQKPSQASQSSTLCCKIDTMDCTMCSAHSTMHIALLKTALHQTFALCI